MDPVLVGEVTVAELEGDEMAVLEGVEVAALGDAEVVVEGTEDEPLDPVVAEDDEAGDVVEVTGAPLGLADVLVVPTGAVTETEVPVVIEVE